MTLLSVAVERSRVLIGADTETVRPDGARLATTKIYPLAHAGAVIAGRGYLLAVASLYTSALMTGLGFDDLASIMPAMISGTVEQLPTKLDQPGPADFDRVQIVLAGWSKPRGRMVGLCYTQEAAGSGIEVAEFVDRTLVAPGEPEWGDIHVETVPQVIDVARRQHAFLRATGPDTAGGGELIVAELTRDRITMEAVWDFESDAPIGDAAGKGGA